VPNDPLTPFSYQQIITEIFGETIQINDAVDVVRMLIDVGCDTNEKLQNFFRRSDILNLREQIIMMDSEAGQAFAKLIVGMPVNSFYVTFGLRFDLIKELIQTFDRVKPKNETSE
jgi:hypothetical protein